MKHIVTTILSALALAVLSACSEGEPEVAGTSASEPKVAGDSASEPEVAGTYELDTNEMVEAMMATMPKEQAAAAERMVGAMKTLKGTMTLKADGSCELSVSGIGTTSGEAREEKGTGSWKLDGDKFSVTVTKASTDGVEARGRGKTIGGTLKGKTLTLTDNLGPMTVAMPWKKK
ncbi:MAG: hypothetical protein VX044_03725 [Planctomycetota bacterium]|nr:hypothetical protein [Planctomycetota bacterium]